MWLRSFWSNRRDLETENLTNEALVTSSTFQNPVCWRCVPRCPSVQKDNRNTFKISSFNANFRMYSEPSISGNHCRYDTHNEKPPVHLWGRDMWCLVWIPHDDVIKWKHFPRYWPFVRGIHRSRWIPRTKASDAELWCFIWSTPE